MTTTKQELIGKVKRRLGIIYIAKNIINGKSYIGKTIRNIDIRKKRHLKDSLSYDSQLLFHRAIRKYGKESFEWKILIECDVDELDKMETKMIEEHDTYYNGYNLTKGGDGTIGWEPPDNWCKGEKHPMYGKHHTKETKRKISDANRNNKYCLGRCLSKNTKDKIAKSQSYKWIITDPEGNSFIIENLKGWCRNNNLQQASMWRVSKGIQKNHKGWKCKKI